MSPIRTGPYLNFQGRAREAMEFYHEVLGGTLDLLAVDGQARRGRPVRPTGSATHGSRPAGGTDRPRLGGIFHRLGEGGNILMPLSRQPCGGDAGWLLDRFGISWTITIDQA